MFENGVKLCCGNCKYGEGHGFIDSTLCKAITTGVGKQAIIDGRGALWTHPNFYCSLHELKEQQ